MLNLRRTLKAVGANIVSRGTPAPDPNMLMTVQVPPHGADSGGVSEIAISENLRTASGKPVSDYVVYRG